MSVDDRYLNEIIFLGALIQELVANLTVKLEMSPMLLGSKRHRKYVRKVEKLIESYNELYDYTQRSVEEKSLQDLNEEFGSTEEVYLLYISKLNLLATEFTFLAEELDNALGKKALKIYNRFHKDSPKTK